MRAFADSNGDGTGDLRGLADKLDYLQWLGVDCLWLPPFYASPLRDGGYDISDFRAVLPEFGTVDDFVHLLEEAHKRDIRVITDLVLNHTSDAHPWFQESRNDPDGPYGDYYVWSDDDSALRRRAHHLRRHRVVQLDVRPGARAVLLAPLLQPPARPQLRERRGPGGDDRRPALLARPRHRRLPARRRALPVRGGGHQLREPPAHARIPPQVPRDGRPRVSRPHPARRGQPVAGGRRGVLRRSRGRRRRVPHGVPLPAHAAHLHGRAPGVALPDLGDPRPDAGDPVRHAVGHLPAQPRRADARDGHRRRARLHVPGVRRATRA